MAVLQGLLGRAYYELAIGQEDRYAGFKLLANRIYSEYEKKISYPGGKERLGLPPLANINQTVLNQLLDPKEGMSFAARAVLRTQLRLPPETVSTNAPPAAIPSADLPESVNTNVPAATAK
jgi:hypothetical protein